MHRDRLPADTAAVIGPQIIATSAAPRPDTVINWLGVNFVPQVARCWSCDHTADMHQPDGCWHTTEHGTPGRDLVCPCSIPRGWGSPPSSPTTDEPAPGQGQDTTGTQEGAQAAPPLGAGAFRAKVDDDWVRINFHSAARYHADGWPVDRLDVAWRPWWPGKADPPPRLDDGQHPAERPVSNWQPGDPLYNDEREPHHCAVCGTTWARGANMPTDCPTCTPTTDPTGSQP